MVETSARELQESLHATGVKVVELLVQLQRDRESVEFRVAKGDLGAIRFWREWRAYRKFNKVQSHLYHARVFLRELEGMLEE